MTHNSSDFLAGAALKSVQSIDLLGYRLGWVSVFRTGQTAVQLGRRINAAGKTEPGGNLIVPAQSVSSDTDRGASVLAFFVAEVYFAEGQPWKADLAETREKARKLAAEN